MQFERLLIWTVTWPPGATGLVSEFIFNGPKQPAAGDALGIGVGIGVGLELAAQSGVLKMPLSEGGQKLDWFPVKLVLRRQ